MKTLYTYNKNMFNEYEVPFGNKQIKTYSTEAQAKHVCEQLNISMLIDTITGFCATIRNNPKFIFKGTALQLALLAKQDLQNFCISTNEIRNFCHIEAIWQLLNESCIHTVGDLDHARYKTEYNEMVTLINQFSALYAPKLFTNQYTPSPAMQEFLAR